MMASAHPAIFSRALAIALIMAGVGPIVISLRILMLEEASTSRAVRLVMIAAAGCFIAAFIGALVSGWLSRRLGSIAVSVISVVLAVPAFIGGFAGAFAIHNRYIVGTFESEPFTAHWLKELALSPAAAVGMFLQTGLKYVLPWPAPLLALLFTGLIWLAFLRR
jgi:uncharacterized protein YacL